MNASTVRLLACFASLGAAIAVAQTNRTQATATANGQVVNHTFDHPEPALAPLPPAKRYAVIDIAAGGVLYAMSHHGGALLYMNAEGLYCSWRRGKETVIGTDIGCVDINSRGQVLFAYSLYDFAGILDTEQHTVTALPSHGSLSPVFEYWRTQSMSEVSIVGDSYTTQYDAKDYLPNGINGETSGFWADTTGTAWTISENGKLGDARRLSSRGIHLTQSGDGATVTFSGTKVDAGWTNDAGDVIIAVDEPGGPPSFALLAHGANEGNSGMKIEGLPPGIVPGQPVALNRNKTIIAVSMPRWLTQAYWWLEDGKPYDIGGEFGSLNNKDEVLIHDGLTIVTPVRGTDENTGQKTFRLDRTPVLQYLPDRWSRPDYGWARMDDDGLIFFEGLRDNEPYLGLAVPATLTVDANRDGTITSPAVDNSDATAEYRPYRFWTNDDDDAITGSSDSDRVPRQSQDWTDHRIECERDLEDFARLQIHTQSLNEAFKNGDFHLGLKWTNTTGTPAIQIFKNRETDGGTGYLNTANNPNLPQQLVQWAVVDARTESQGPIAGQRTIEGSGVFILPSSLFSNLTDAQPKTHLLFEGCRPGKGQLKLVILKKEGASYTEIGEGPGVWLDLKSIKSMYEGPGTAFEQPVGEAPQGIVFVHGWNMSPDGSVNFAETMFKRLWHRGFKGRFVSLRWNTNYSDAFDNVPLIGEAVEGYLADYNGSERVAWQSGAIVKAAVDGLPAGYSRNIVAHSMGNIIAGSALLAGVSFDNYVLMQAAVPASCYDHRALLQQGERPSPQTYAGFRPTFWEAGVSPDDDPVPETRALSYRGRLSASVGNLVSFYLPDDHATTYAWEFNNDQTKPISGYGYTRGASVVLGSQRAIWRQIGTGPSAFQDSLTDPFVAMPFVCRSWSKVVGAESRTAGVIQGSFSLNSSPLFFDTEHSAQFNRSIQALRPFYDELLRRLGMEPTP